jgi:hypothetical protein
LIWKQKPNLKQPWKDDLDPLLKNPKGLVIAFVNKQKFGEYGFYILNFKN